MIHLQPLFHTSHLLLSHLMLRSQYNLISIKDYRRGENRNIPLDPLPFSISRQFWGRTDFIYSACKNRRISFSRPWGVLRVRRGNLPPNIR